jgi:hypothetical protein
MYLSSWRDISFRILRRMVRRQSVFQTITRPRACDNQSHYSLSPMMPIDTGNDIHCKPGQIDTSTSVWTDAGRLARRCLLLLASVLCLLVASNANAQTSWILGDFATNAESDIDQTPKISAMCVNDTVGGTRTYAGWQIKDAAGNIIAKNYYDSLDNWDATYGEKVSLATLTNPGENYVLETYCAAQFIFHAENVAWNRREFKVASLSGSATTSIEKNTVTVSGTVGNGANGVLVMIDGDVVAVEKELTSDFSVEVSAAVGTHAVKVFATYDKHTQLIGSSDIKIHAPPEVTISAVREFTQSPAFVITGTATSEADINSAWYEWQAPADAGGGRSGYITVTPAKRFDFFEHIDLIADGTHRFRIWAKAGDKQENYSKWASTMLDRKPPELLNLTTVKDGFLSADTELRVKASDLDPRDENGSGIESVQIEATDKDGVKYGWRHMTLQSGTLHDGEYTIPIGSLFTFKDVPAGNVRFQVWAQDRAKNPVYANRIVYKKAKLPIASVTVPAAPTNKDSIALGIKIDGEVEIRKIWMDAWKIDKDGKQIDIPRADIGFTKSKYVAFNHPFQFPYGEGKYSFRIIAEADDKQQTDMSKQEVMRAVFDKTKPTVELLSPKADSKHKTELEIKFKVEDRYGSGVEDVQMEVCKKGEDCNTWLTGIPNDGKGVYSQTLPLTDLESGAFTVTIWVKDKADNREWAYFDFDKELNAGDAATPTLSFKATDGSDASAPFYPDTERLLRVAVAAQAKIEGGNMAYALPDGLSQAGPAGLNSALSSNAPASASQLSQWRGNGNLLTGVDMEKDAVIVIDIPVKMSKTLPQPKISMEDQTTFFEVTGKNFSGTARAEAIWRGDWKMAPADLRLPVSRTFDLSALSDIDIWSKQSGGYDTAEPAKWNRNSLHCSGSEMTCTRNAFDTDIKLRFTEQTSKKTVDLTLSGTRHQTLLNGRPSRTGALDASVNPGVDAEARFSVSLSKNALARLPGAGQWRAHLAMDLQDHANTHLADFSSDLVLNVSDTTGMALQPPRIALLDGSHQDNDRSGSFTTGNTLTYRIVYEATRDLKRFQLDYALPPGLAHEGNPSFHGAGGTIQPPLSDDQGSKLLRFPIDIKKGQILVIDVPLRIQSGAAARVVSQVFVVAEDFDAMPSDEAILNIQRRFGVSESLALTLEMLEMVGQDALIAQQTPFTYRVVLSAKTQALDSPSLSYRLPGGMQAAGKPVLKDAASHVKLAINAQWDGDADTELLAGGATLPRGESIAIEIPVMVKDVVGDGVFVQSSVDAGAANLDGTLQKSHRIKIRERTVTGDRVRIVKSMDAAAAVQPGANIRYQIRVSNQTFKTVRNLLIRDRAPDHTTLIDASCGDLPAASCKTLTLSDADVADGNMTHAALCRGTSPPSDPQGKHVFWCLNGDLEPLADYTVDYSVRIDGAAPAP